MIASAGMEAIEEMVGEGNGESAGKSRKAKSGGWSVGREEGNHMLLYIWILKGDWSGWGNGA